MSTPFDNSAWKVKCMCGPVVRFIVLPPRLTNCRIGTRTFCRKREYTGGGITRGGSAEGSLGRLSSSRTRIIYDHLVCSNRLGPSRKVRFNVIKHSYLQCTLGTQAPVGRHASSRAAEARANVRSRKQIADWYPSQNQIDKSHHCGCVSRLQS